jgi:hypothetical protein
MGQFHPLSPTISTQYGVNLRNFNQFWISPHCPRLRLISNLPTKIILRYGARLSWIYSGSYTNIATRKFNDVFEKGDLRS